MCARILAFDHPGQSPDGCFVRIADRNMLAAQALAESRTEEALGGRGRIAAVEIVVGIGVKEAIANDRRRHLRGLVEEGLEAVGGPGVPASLNDLRHGEASVEVARAASEFDPGREEALSDEIDGWRFKAEHGGSETGEYGNEAVPEGDAVCRCARTAVKASLHGAETVIVDTLARALLLQGVDGTGRQRPVGAGVPCGTGVRSLGLEPRPGKGFLHMQANTKMEKR
jgi:hypothetical protein